MKLSQKDKEFLERLKELMEEDTVWVERRMAFPSQFVLRGNYGDGIEKWFRLTRQGVRWRFQRLFNGIYIEAYEVIIFLEKYLGNGFRQDALSIAHERFVARQDMLRELNFTEANRYRGTNENRD